MEWRAFAGHLVNDRLGYVPPQAVVEIAKLLELAPAQRRTLARILLELSEEDQDFSPEAEAVWENEIVRRMETVKAGTARHSPCAGVFARLDQRFAP